MKKIIPLIAALGIFYSSSLGAQVNIPKPSEYETIVNQKQSLEDILESVERLYFEQSYMVTGAANGIEIGGIVQKSPQLTTGLTIGIIDDKAYFLTNNHLLEMNGLPAINAPFKVTQVNLIEEEVYVNKNDKKISLEVVYQDPELDIAVLRTKEKDGHLFNKISYKFGDFNKVKLGMVVYLIGNPLGRFEDYLINGIVSSIPKDKTRFMISAPLLPGDSGGPIVAKIDDEYMLIGIGVSLVAYEDLLMIRNNDVVRFDMPVPGISEGITINSIKQSMSKSPILKGLV
jgi:S1-C subfamily serine protease